MGGNWKIWVDYWGQLGGLMGPNRWCGGSVGGLVGNWKVLVDNWDV